MMSDSDDTDVLLLIPPDLFIVPSSDSDDNLDCSSYKNNNTSVVSELIEQVQSLESRVTAIETKDSPTNSLSLGPRLSIDSVMNCRQTLPRTKFSVSQNSSLQTTPTKYPQCLSLPSTPSIRQHHTNETHHNTKLHGNYHNYMSNSKVWNKHDHLKLFSEPASQSKSLLHVGNGSYENESCSMLLPSLNVCESNYNIKSCSSLPILNSSSTSTSRLTSDLKPIKDMSLSEVDEYIRELENTNKLFATHNGNCNVQTLANPRKSPEKKISIKENDSRDKRKGMENQKIKFNMNGYNPSSESVYQPDFDKRRDVSDVTGQDCSFSSLDTEKFMSEFKAWTPSFQSETLNDSKFVIPENKSFQDYEKVNGTKQKEPGQKINEINIQTFMPKTAENSLLSISKYLDANLLEKYNEDFSKSQTIASSVHEVNQDTLKSSCKSCPNIYKTPSNTSISNPLDALVKKTDCSTNTANETKSTEQNITRSRSEVQNERPQRLLTLSDFWSNNSSKSLEEQLRNKLEEERFRREHCEQLIQDLQKKLLEQQEKVAVAVRVDNEKNSVISQFQLSWAKIKQKLCEVESERESLQKILKSVTEKHQSEITDSQEQIKKYKEELSKALNLATGYKEKSDSLVKEKVDILKNHADELENYKSLVQQAESRYEEMKVECQKLLEKNQQSDEALKSVQQELNKELLKGSEVRSEMAVIHKVLDACEAELAILRQEKEGLQLKLKEEVNRNTILQQGKESLVTAIDEAKKAEKTAKNELKILTEQQEKLRAELRDVYQKQVDEVVKSKLQEFQTQLDSAEMVFQNEIDTKQRAIAECAARKIKSVIDKHQLEINLIEEKQKEEKRLYEIKLAQAMQKAAMLEAQLNSYRKSKNQLVEQLYTMMQKQWQQALLIISGGNPENVSCFQKISVDKLFELPSEPNIEFVPNHCSTIFAEPMKLDSQKSLTNLQNVQTQDQQQNESLVTLTSHDETPVTSRKESKNDFKKYIKMILDMQESKERSKPKLFSSSPPSPHKEYSSKPSSHKDMNTSNEGSSTWQPISEISMHDTSEYLSVPNKFGLKCDLQKQKPPWK